MSGATHTPGPWMAAAAPSSVVGWPVVGPQGRSICNVSYIGYTPPDVSEADLAAFRAVCMANARLIAAAPELLESVRDLKELFRFALLSTSPDIARDGMAFIRKAEAVIAKATP